MKRTLGDARDPSSGIPQVLNIAPSDARVARYVNEAQNRLLNRGKWWGCYMRVRLCVDSDCITLPRQIASVEAITFEGRPMTIRNEFFEFLESGNGIADGTQCTDGTHCGGGLSSGGSCGCGALNAYQRGCAPTFADICGTNKKIKVYADVTESGSAVITLQGYDENNNWIRTQVGGNWIEGEQVAINAASPVTSTKFFSALVAVQKPVTNGVVRLYEYNTDDTTQRAIAIYEPDETQPEYRRIFIKGVKRKEGDACQYRTILAMAKLEFIPAVKDTDWLLIGNLPALKFACKAIKFEEANDVTNAAIYMNGGRIGSTMITGAIGELDVELRHYKGSGIVQPIRRESRELSGAAVHNML